MNSFTNLTLDFSPVIIKKMPMVNKSKGQMAKRFILLSIALITARRVSSAPACDLLPPMEGKEGPEFGMVLVPGDTLKGESYQPLSVALQVGPLHAVWLIRAS